MKQVTLLFLRQNGHLLLALKKRGFGAGLWNGIGGKVEQGETPLQACVRECREEIGITPHDLHLVGRLRFFMPNDPQFEHDCFIYTTEKWEGEPTESDEMRPQWFSAADIPYQMMWPADGLWLPHVLANEKFAGTINTSETEVVTHDIRIVADPHAAGEKTTDMPRQSDMTFNELNKIIWDYMVARDWHHNPPRGLATSIMLEAGELLEHYQWTDSPVGSKEELAEELADIFLYAFQFAQINNIDITDAIQKKLDKAGKKYPAHKFKGKMKADWHDTWVQQKLSHKKKGL
ncbi:MAG TPA: NUDIX domain-containing protein [Candidatus Saccharimonadales bacterium]